MRIGSRNCPGGNCRWRFLERILRLKDCWRTSVHLGDRFSVGTAEVVVTQPRLPCYKLGIRFQADDMVKRFLASGRSGFYVAVTREGKVGAGDEIKELSRDSNRVSIADIVRLYVAKKYTSADVGAGAPGLESSGVPGKLEGRIRGADRTIVFVIGLAACERGDSAPIIRWLCQRFLF